MASASLRPASDLIILLLNDVLVHCPSSGRNMRIGAFVGHECTSSPTGSEVHMAADVLIGIWSPTAPLMSAWSKSLQEAELSVFIICWYYHHSIFLK